MAAAVGRVSVASDHSDYRPVLCLVLAHNPLPGPRAGEGVGCLALLGVRISTRKTMPAPQLECGSVTRFGHGGNAVDICSVGMMPTIGDEQWSSQTE